MYIPLRCTQRKVSSRPTCRKGGPGGLTLKPPAQLCITSNFLNRPPNSSQRTRSCFPSAFAVFAAANSQFFKLCRHSRFFCFASTISIACGKYLYQQKGQIRCLYEPFSKACSLTSLVEVISKKTSMRIVSDRGKCKPYEQEYII